jgi:hypothetical protein
MEVGLHGQHVQAVIKHVHVQTQRHQVVEQLVLASHLKPVVLMAGGHLGLHVAVAHNHVRVQILRRQVEVLRVPGSQHNHVE